MEFTAEETDQWLQQEQWKDVDVLVEHEANRLVGKVLAAKKNDRGEVVVTAEICADTPEGRAIATKIQNQELTGLSIGHEWQLDIDLPTLSPQQREECLNTNTWELFGTDCGAHTVTKQIKELSVCFAPMRDGCHIYKSGAVAASQKKSQDIYQRTILTNQGRQVLSIKGSKLSHQMSEPIQAPNAQAAASEQPQQTQPGAQPGAQLGAQPVAQSQPSAAQFPQAVNPQLQPNAQPNAPSNSQPNAQPNPALSSQPNAQPNPALSSQANAQPNAQTSEAVQQLELQATQADQSAQLLQQFEERERQHQETLQQLEQLKSQLDQQKKEQDDYKVQIERQQQEAELERQKLAEQRKLEAEKRRDEVAARLSKLLGKTGTTAFADPVEQTNMLEQAEQAILKEKTVANDLQTLKRGHQQVESAAAKFEANPLVGATKASDMNSDAKRRALTVCKTSVRMQHAFCWHSCK